MRDAVAEELKERERLEASPGRFLAGSFLAHIALAAAIIAGQMAADEPQKRNIINVRLSSGGTSAATPIQTPRRAPRRAPAVRAPEQSPVPMTKPVPPASRPVTKPPTKKVSAGETLFGKSERPAASAPAPTTQPVAEPSTSIPPAGSAAPGLSTTGPIGAPGLGQAGVLSLEGGPFPFNDYLERMIALVGRRWQRPVTGTEPSATVYFVIERNGRIRDVRIEEPSGMGAFDRAAMRAVLESSPLPPLPNGYGGDWLGVHLAFH